MDNINFVNQIKEVCIKESIAHDIELLSSSEPDGFNDSIMYDLAKAWQAADQNTKNIFQHLMYLSSKNSIAATLHLIDTQFSIEVNSDDLAVGELLDVFMEQSET